jgi:PAS domain S-box-containing protein
MPDLGLRGSRLVQSLNSFFPVILTVAILAVTTLLRVLLTPLLGTGYAFITYYPAIIFSTIIGGWKYGLLASLASEVLAALLFIDPIVNSEHAAALLVFLLLSGLMIMSSELVLRGRRHAELKTDLVLAREEVLKQEIAGRQRAEVALREDIRSRQQTEHQLQKSQDMLLHAQRAAKAGVWEIDLVTARMMWSRPYYEVFGLDYSIEPTLNTWLSCVHPEDRERIAAEYRSSIRECRDQNMEFRIIKPDTRTMRWIHRKGQVQFDDEGQPVRVSGISFDITERKTAEEGLRESEQRLTGLVNTAMDAIVTVDATQKIILFNRAAELMFGCSADEALDYPLERFIPVRYRHAHGQHMTNFDRTGVTQRRMGEYGTIYGLRANGEEFPIEASISQLEVNNQKFYTVILRDITQRKIAEEELRVLTVELDKRVAIRTQELVQSQDRMRALATELNLAEQRERKKLAEELHDHLQQVLVLGKLKVAQAKQSSGLSDLMKQLEEIFSMALTYTRTLVAELSPPVLREQGLAEALKWLGAYMHKYGMVVFVSIPEKFHLELPEDQKILLFQSVRELLINASKHSGSHEVWVSVEQGEEKLRIHVQDKGVGFDLAFVATSAKNDPMGSLSSQFGLFSIRERMRGLGGKLDIRSSPGNGTTASLELPVTHPRKTENTIEDTKTLGAK